jgi:uncharacterized protein (TIGR00297 family)
MRQHSHSSPRVIFGIVLSSALLLAVIPFSIARALSPDARIGFADVLVCATFAIVAFALGGVTYSGAFAGFAVAMAMLVGKPFPFFAMLVVVFVLTWLATRARATRKRRMRIAERSRGRDGIQVLANVGLAAALVILCNSSRNSVFTIECAVGAAAALAEAAADTVSSEIGKAFGGSPLLITTWKSVDVGANGGITALGSLAGIAAAALVAAVPAGFNTPALDFLAIAIAAIAGMFFDSALGATLEDRWLNNDGVNFLSTCFAAAVADGLVWLTSRLH